MVKIKKTRGQMVDKTLYLRYAPKSKVLILKDLYNTAQKSVPFGNVPAKLNMLCHKLFNLTYYPGQVTYILNQWQI